MSMAAIGITSLALTGISMGMSAAGVGQPKQPDMGSSSKALSDTKAGLLPFQRGLEAAAKSGGDYKFTLPPGTSEAALGITTTGAGWYDESGRLVSTNQNPSSLNMLGRSQNKRTPTGQAAASASTTAPALKWRAGTTTINGVPVTKNSDGSYTVSFKGYGEADTQGKLAQQNAQTALELSKKYDSEFINSALEQEKLADPEGVAARGRMHELIGEQADNHPDQPVARMLDEQVGAQLRAGKGLDDFDKAALERAVSESLGSRGGGGEGADFSQPLTTGFAGEGRRAAGARKALAFMTSGATPEDVDYRREQQDIANLSAEINGQTPQSQFSSLSSAQRGPTPQVNGTQLPTMSGGTAARAVGNATTRYGAQLAQPNQWMAGLSTLINVAGAAGQAGWKPLGG